MANYLTLTLENIAVKHTPANLPTLEYYIRLGKRICVGD